MPDQPDTASDQPKVQAPAAPGGPPGSVQFYIRVLLIFIGLTMIVSQIPDTYIIFKGYEKLNKRASSVEVTTFSVKYKIGEDEYWCDSTLNNEQIADNFRVVYYDPNEPSRCREAITRQSFTFGEIFFLLGGLIVMGFGIFNVTRLSIPWGDPGPPPKRPSENNA